MLCQISYTGSFPRIPISGWLLASVSHWEFWDGKVEWRSDCVCFRKFNAGPQHCGSSSALVLISWHLSGRQFLNLSSLRSSSSPSSVSLSLRQVYTYLHGKGHSRLHWSSSIKIRGSKKQRGIPVCAYAFQFVWALMHRYPAFLTDYWSGCPIADQVEYKIQHSRLLNQLLW